MHLLGSVRVSMMVALRPCLLLLTFICILCITQTDCSDERKKYIVYMGSLPKDLEANSLPSLHMSMAQRILGSDFAPDAVTHSYNKSFNGFVVKMTEAEAARMRGLESVISVFESKNHEVATTKSWNCADLPRNVHRPTREEGHGFNESDIVVAVIDTGIYSEHKTFTMNDANYPQSAEMKDRWKDQCPDHCCNNKIVGAKSIRGGKVIDSECPHDILGHGTHVASIIAGREIERADGTMVRLTEPDENNRTVRGGVPGARIAVYKVCSWVEKDGPDGKISTIVCEDCDILTAFDEAIADGVHLISVSLARKSTDTDCKEYFESSYAIGAFHAMQRNILTSVAAGNEGPKAYSMATHAPWSLSVAASTIGRKFFTNVTVYEEHKEDPYFTGVSINAYPTHTLSKNLRTYKDCFPSSKTTTGEIFLYNKVVLPSCVGALGSESGTVLEGDEPLDLAAIYATPAAVLKKSDYNKISSQYNRAKINTSLVNSTSCDPSIASISSRGPDPIMPNILKPDLAAPGVHILAAWPLNISVSNVQGDKRVNNADYTYSVQTGTSMACPHVTAAAAYVKSFHHDWSPAAIKSALMTTATVMEPKTGDGAEFAYGAGQINISRAIHPGLVYNASEEDYYNFLCAQGYDEKKMKILSQGKGECTDHNKKEGRVENLNLPSFAFSCNFQDGNKCSADASFERTVENVEPENSKYEYVISPSPTPTPSLKIEVDPKCLSFEKKGDKKKFTLKIEGELTDKDKDSASSSWMEKVSAALIWRKVDSCGTNAKFIDGGYEVRSPIVIYNRKRECKTASKPIVKEEIYQLGYQEGREDASTFVDQ